MALENATTISELVPTNPPSSDPKSQGDDHLRMIKACLQSVVTQAIAEDGTNTTPQIWSPERIAQAIEAKNVSVPQANFKATWNPSGGDYAPGVYHLISANVELWDETNDYDNTTFKFVPAVNGIYELHCNHYINLSNPDHRTVEVALFKDGAFAERGMGMGAAFEGDWVGLVSAYSVKVTDAPNESYDFRWKHGEATEGGNSLESIVWGSRVF